MQPPNSFDEYCALTDSFMSAYFKQISHVYVDLECCFDFKLGALLNLIRTSVEYNYLLHRLPFYERATDLETAKYFPALHFTEEQLLSVLKDPSVAENVILSSPMTEWWSNLGRTIASINTSNQSKNTNNPVTFHFNCLMVEIPEELKQRIIKSIHAIDSSIQVEFSSTDINTRAVAFLTAMDCFVIYDLIHFFAKDSICSKLGEKEMFVTKSISARVQTTYQDNIEERLQNQLLVMAAVCEFSFIRNRIVTKDDQ